MPRSIQLIGRGFFILVGQVANLPRKRASMFLTDEEKKMLDGTRGPVLSQAMEILCALGDIYGAERMVRVDSVHMPGASYVVAGEAGTRYVENTAANGGVFSMPTTLNTGGTDLARSKELGYPDDILCNQTRLTNAYRQMGAVACHTCTPYLIGYAPRLGQHVAWGESSAIAFANSVLGARTNREGGPSALASALTGRTAAYGFHLTENRRGQVLVNARCELSHISDFGRLGYCVGKVCQEQVPVFDGISTDVTPDELKMLGAALASSGSVALFHAVGITPEAPTLEAAFDGAIPKYSLDITHQELDQASASLNKNRGEPIGIVALGCPHASVEEIGAVARHLDGKRIADGVALWVLTSEPLRALAERMGFAQQIEQAGGRVVRDTCPILSPIKSVVEKFQYRSIATNSAKLAHYAPGQWSTPTYFGDLDQCLRSAISGKWEP